MNSINQIKYILILTIIPVLLPARAQNFIGENIDEVRKALAKEGIESSLDTMQVFGERTPVLTVAYKDFFVSYMAGEKDRLIFLVQIYFTDRYLFNNTVYHFKTELKPHGKNHWLSKDGSLLYSVADDQNGMRVYIMKVFDKAYNEQFEKIKNIVR